MRIVYSKYGNCNIEEQISFVPCSSNGTLIIMKEEGGNSSNKLPEERVAGNCEWYRKVMGELELENEKKQTINTYRNRFRQFVECVSSNELTNTAYTCFTFGSGGKIQTLDFKKEISQQKNVEIRINNIIDTLGNIKYVFLVDKVYDNYPHKGNEYDAIVYGSSNDRIKQESLKGFKKNGICFFSVYHPLHHPIIDVEKSKANISRLIKAL